LAFKPHITLQIAHSGDGYIARPGERTPLSCPQSWDRVRAARADYDAIMIGINTALTDNPKLLSTGEKTPVRVVVDTMAGLDPDSELARTAGETPVWLLTSESDPMLEALGIRLIECALREDRIDLPDAMEKLFENGIQSVICEGGAALAQSLTDERLVDDLILIESNLLLGSGIALPIFANYKFLKEEKTGTDTWRFYKRA